MSSGTVTLSALVLGERACFWEIHGPALCLPLQPCPQQAMQPSLEPSDFLEVLAFFRGEPV